MNKHHDSLSRVPLSELEEAAIWMIRNVVLPSQESAHDEEEETMDG